jgi:hypothetical protein
MLSLFIYNFLAQVPNLRIFKFAILAQTKNIILIIEIFFSLFFSKKESFICQLGNKMNKTNSMVNMITI